jgi:hypothetical protein
MIHIRPLHIAAAAAPDVDAGVVAALDHYVPASVDPVVNVHTAPVVVEPGDVSIRAPGNGAMGCLHGGVAVRGRTAMSAGRAAVGRHVVMAAGRIGSEVLPARRTGAVRRAGAASGAGMTGGCPGAV